MNTNQTHQSNSSIIAPLWACCFLVWLGMAAVSAWNVGDGIQALQFYKNRPAWFSQSYAVMLQASVALASILIPIMIKSARSWRAIIPIVLLMCGAVSIIAGVGYFETKHSVLYVVKNGMAGDVRENAFVELNSMNKQIDAVSVQITNRYQTRVNELGKLSSDAGRGYDETGIAVCGNNCQGYRLRQQAAREEYADLAISALSVSALSERNIQALTQNIDERLLVVTTKLDRLNTFLLEEQARSREALRAKGVPILTSTSKPASPVADISPIIVRLGEQLKAKREKYGNKLSMDEKDFAIQEVEDVYALLWQFKLPSAPYRWALMYSLAPFGVSVLFGFVIGFYPIRRSVVSVAALQEELEEELENKEILEELAEVKRANWLTRLRTQFFDREPKIPAGIQPA